jgi:carbonic anhydrase
MAYFVFSYFIFSILKIMFKNIKQDLPASVVVFLVALPLCLGIALASGAPLLSGLLAGIVGGLVVGFLSESHTSVSGPAAGLAAVVLAAITELGSFEIFLMAVVIAGGIQLAAGIGKAGFIANYIPTSVIKGLLAAIGILLILKQIPHAVGFDKDPEGDFTFFERDGDNTFNELLEIFDFFTWGAVIIATISLVLLLFWDKIPFKRLKALPVSLVVVIVGVLLNGLFIKYFPSLALEPTHLVSIPKINSFDALLTFPDWTSILSLKVWKVAFTIAVVASLETLLNLSAAENLDPQKRKASPNRELVAQGIGNILSGLVGGLPITSVIVRSSVNINAGAATKLSAILHAVFLLLSVLILSQTMNLIPLSALAAILLVTGYKLANISIFKEFYEKGWNQFIPFVATIAAIVFTDLLIGVIIGFAVSVFYILKSNFQNPFVIQKETLHVDETTKITLPTQVSFFNKAPIKDILWAVPSGSKVIIDASNAEFIDADVLDLIETFRNSISPQKNIKLNIMGMHAKMVGTNVLLKDEVQFVDVIDKATQVKLQPDEVLALLKKGNARFLKGNVANKQLTQQMKVTSLGQNPFASVLSCIDSRTTVEHVFDLGLGDIFSIRIAGNILNQDILGSMEFGVHQVGVKLILVLGHTKCGAVAGACSHVELGNLTPLLQKVQPAISRETTITVDRTGANPSFVNKVAAQNVLHTIERIRAESEIIREFEAAGTIKIVGAMYDVETGIVDFFE